SRPSRAPHRSLARERRTFVLDYLSPVLGARTEGRASTGRARADPTKRPKPSIPSSDTRRDSSAARTVAAKSIASVFTRPMQSRKHAEAGLGRTRSSEKPLEIGFQ